MSVEGPLLLAFPRGGADATCVALENVALDGGAEAAIALSNTEPVLGACWAVAVVPRPELEADVKKGSARVAAEEGLV